MAHWDLAGLTIAVAGFGALSGIGIGIDSLLLARHVKAIDELSVRWWLFFDNLRIADIPRIAVSTYIRGKNKVLGEGLTASTIFRSFLLSIVLTTITVPGGRILGLYLTLRCQRATPLLSWQQIVQIGWGWTGMSTLSYLAVVNIVFDLATIFTTIIILSQALKKPDYFLLALILVDVLVCVILFYNAIYISDQFDSASQVSAGGYWTLITSFVGMFSLGCPAFHLLASKVLFVSAILLPTIIYLVMIIMLFFLREGFKLFKFIAMYVLEKSVEDKKTIFAHLGTTLGLVVLVGKASLEVFKALSA